MAGVDHCCCCCAIRWRGLEKRNEFLLSKRHCERLRPSSLPGNELKRKLIKNENLATPLAPTAVITAEALPPLLLYSRTTIIPQQHPSLPPSRFFQATEVTSILVFRFSCAAPNRMHALPALQEGRGRSGTARRPLTKRKGENRASRRSSHREKNVTNILPFFAGKFQTTECTI